MKHSILIIFLFLMGGNIVGQTFNSKIETNNDGEVKLKDRTVEITDEKISITNYLNGGIETLIIEIDRIENKYSWKANKEATWYYGSGSDKNWIIIYVDGYSKNLYIYQILDEVNNIKKYLGLE